MAYSPASKTADPLEPLYSALQSGSPPPIVYLCGKEQFLVNRAVEAVKSAVLDQATRDFNYDVFQAKDAPVSKILAAARTLPMMARRRLVLVRDADELDAAEMVQLGKYTEAPVPEACLCLVAEKADLRLRFFTQIKKQGLLLKLEPLSERQLPAFVESEARRLKVKLQPGAAARLADEIGADLGQLVDALGRLANYVAEGQPIKISDVEEVVATTRQHSVFELIDAVGAGDRAQALSLLGGMLAQREPALRLLAMLGRHVRQLWQTCDLVHGGHGGRAGAAEVASALGVMPFVATKLLDQARRLSLRRVTAMHEAIYQVDRALKLSKLDDERLMEQLVLRLCAPAAAA
ncbi:MAG: DNA polymerase III subunit delta [Polyangia bacterium]